MKVDEYAERREVSREELVEVLRQGAETSEAKKMLRIWCNLEEVKVDQTPDRVEASIKYDVRLGLLYAEAGYAEEAIDSLDAALTKALHEEGKAETEELGENLRNYIMMLTMRSIN